MMPRLLRFVLRFGDIIEKSCFHSCTPSTELYSLLVTCAAAQGAAEGAQPACNAKLQFYCRPRGKFLVRRRSLPRAAYINPTGPAGRFFFSSALKNQEFGILLRRGMLGVYLGDILVPLI